LMKPILHQYPNPQIETDKKEKALVV